MFDVKSRLSIGKAAALAATIGLFSLGAVFGWFGREQFVTVPAPQQPSNDNLAAVPSLLRDINAQTPLQETQSIVPEATVEKFDVRPPISWERLAETDSEPSYDEVIAALENTHGVKLDVRARDSATIVTKMVQDVIDQPRRYPMIGPAQLHHVQYECTVSYTRAPPDSTVELTPPRNRFTRVVYIDRDHFHQVEDGESADEPAQPQDDATLQPSEEAPIAFDPPSDDEVMRALEDASTTEREWPFLVEMKRDDVRIVKELVKEEVDEPRVYPLMGPAQLHHVRYKCTVIGTKATRFSWPFAFTMVDENVKGVVYINHEHFHAVFGTEAVESQQRVPKGADSQ
jgi:hypothetical protein